MPPDHSVRFHDQEHLAEPAPIEHPGQHRQDRPVGFGEPGPVDLTLKNEDLMSEGNDLGITLIAGREEPADPREHQTDGRREETHRSTVRLERGYPTNTGSDEFLTPSWLDPRWIGVTSPGRTKPQYRARSLPALGFLEYAPWDLNPEPAD